MPARLRTVAALIAAIALSTLLAATANANRIAVSETEITHEWSEWTITFTPEVRITCALTLEGSINASTINKSVAPSVGQITRAAVSECTERLVLLTETLPWNIAYNAFQGTLPNIEALQFDFVGIAFQATMFGLECLYQATTEGPARWTDSLEEGGGVTNVDWDDDLRVPRSSGSIICPSSVTFSGDGTLTETGTETPLSITLV